MKRTCVINVAGLSGRLLGSAGDALGSGRLSTGPRPMRSILPAVTCSVQASLTTGVTPAGHGIVANGLYLPARGGVRFWEQSNELLTAERFWHGGDLPHKPRVAMLFWQNSMDGAADIVVTPRPKHTPDGRTVSWCFSQPAGLYERLIGELGEFDLSSFWGPMASIESSRWITACALAVWRDERPDLQLVYLPHLDYDSQRWGPDDPRMAAEVHVVGELLDEIIAAVTDDGGECVICSEYGLVPVGRCVTPNILLREAGLLGVREVDAAEELDVAGSRAFAMVDHQIAHVYATDAAAIAAAGEALSGVPGIAAVLTGEQLVAAGLDHPRSGQLVALAEGDAWFAYYWWTDPTRAPAFAATVDIHRKPGYDPCELFIDPRRRCIPCEPALVKASHGLIDVAPPDQAILAATCELDAPDDPAVTDLPAIVRGVMFGRGS